MPRFILILLLYVTGAFSEPITPFGETGRAEQRYDKIVSQIHQGSAVSYPDGSKFQILSRLEGGDTNLIYRAELVSTGEVGILRVPKDRESLQFATATLRGYALLQAENIPVPKLLLGREGQYVFQEEVSVELTALNLLEGNLGKAGLSEEVLFQRLLEFFKQTARFRRLDDLHPGNVAFDGKKWIALDWQGNHAFIESGKTKTLLDSWMGEKNTRPPVTKFWQEAEDSIQRVRALNLHWLKAACEAGLIKAAF